MGRAVEARSPDRGAAVLTLTRWQAPKSLCVTAKHTLLALWPFLEEVVLHDADGFCIRCRHQAYGPVGAHHQPIRSEGFEGYIEKRDDLLRLPMLPVGFSDQS